MPHWQLTVLHRREKFRLASNFSTITINAKSQQSDAYIVLNTRNVNQEFINSPNLLFTYKQLDQHCGCIQ